MIRLLFKRIPRKTCTVHKRYINYADGISPHTKLFPSSWILNEKISEIERMKYYSKNKTGDDIFHFCDIGAGTANSINETALKLFPNITLVEPNKSLRDSWNDNLPLNNALKTKTNNIKIIKKTVQEVNDEDIKQETVNVLQCVHMAYYFNYNELDHMIKKLLSYIVLEPECGLAIISVRNSDSDFLVNN
eukprot:175375_1